MTQERFFSLIENSLLHLYFQAHPMCSVSERNQILTNFLLRSLHSCDLETQLRLKKLLKCARKPNVNLELIIRPLVSC